MPLASRGENDALRVLHELLVDEKLGAAQIQRRVIAGLEKLFRGANAANTLIWTHNLGVARNLLLTRELTRACAARGLPLVMHHHDWWFDNRWRRWREMRRYGIQTLQAAARAIFPAALCPLASGSAKALPRPLPDGPAFAPIPAAASASAASSTSLPKSASITATPGPHPPRRPR